MVFVIYRFLLSLSLSVLGYGTAVNICFFPLFLSSFFHFLYIDHALFYYAVRLIPCSA